MNILSLKTFSLIAYISKSEISISWPFWIIISISLLLFLISFIAYAHQIVHTIIGIFVKPKEWKETNNYHKYGFIICARNEEKVIGQLIDSINKQNYDKDKIKIFVVADNCTDNTAEVAKSYGANVFVRHDTQNVGKSFALDYILNKILNNNEYDDIEAFMVFDADNLVDKNFTHEMNKLFDANVKVATSFRATKNYSNWVSAGSALTFYRECCLLHRSRGKLNISTFISGTGFFVSRDIVKKYDGWKFNTMIEDIEFSLNCSLDNIKIEYCEKAIFYDEQPIKLKDSINQRLRWCKGTHQCFAKYENKLFKKALIKNINCSSFEMLVHVLPLPIILYCWSFIYLALSALFLLIKNSNISTFFFIGFIPFIGIYVYMFLLAFITGVITTIMERKNIPCCAYKRFIYCFTFPLYLYYYLPISLHALFKKKISWKQIPHSEAKTIDSMEDIIK